MKLNNMILALLAVLLVIVIYSCVSKKKTLEQSDIHVQPEKVKIESTLSNLKEAVLSEDKFRYKDRNLVLPEFLDLSYKDKKYQLEFAKRETNVIPGIPYILTPSLYKMEEKKLIPFGLSYNGLYNDGHQIELQSPSNRYLFIPTKSRLIVDLSNERMIHIPGADFELIGNIFYERFMLMITKRALVVVNLENEMSSAIYFDDDTKVKWAELNFDGNIIYVTEEEPSKISKVKYRTLEFNEYSRIDKRVENAFKQIKYGGGWNPPREEFTEDIDGKRYTIILDGLDEPNNGRMVTLGKFFINREDQNVKYQSSYFKFNFGNKNFFSHNEKYILIPYESGPRIFYTDGSHTFNILTGYSQRADGDYKGHVFFDDTVVIYMEKGIHICNLETKMSERISASKTGYVNFTSDKELVLNIHKEGVPTQSCLLTPSILN